jgi:glycosidase
MTSAARRLSLSLALSLAFGLAVAPALAAPAFVASVEIAGAGGDAWTFRKRVEGRADPSCDAVELRSPAGTVAAWLDGDRFGGEVPLAEGDNEVRAACLAGGRELAVSAPQAWRVRLEDAPRAWIRASVRDGTVRLDGGRSEPAEGQPAPIVSWSWSARPGNPAPIAFPAPGVGSGAGAGGRAVEVPVPAADGEYHVELAVADALGRTGRSAAVFRVVGGRPVEVDPARERPSWVEGAVVYGVVPALFGPRGLDDVTARLDRIAALGATVLWLSPITAAPPDDFGYAVTDHHALRPETGTEEDLRELVAAAHARGLRVIMDFVPNHAAVGHAYWRDAQARGEASPYARFFDRDTTHYFGWEHLRNLDFDEPEVRRYVTEAFARWVRAFGVDGFRVDVAWGVRERAPEFWPRWREEMKRIDPDLLLLAEASARDPYYAANGFDGAYDWTARLGEWAWHDAFGEGVPTARRLRAALEAGGAGGAPRPGAVLRFINNNDTGARFVTRHGPGRTRVAAALLMTLPGLPLVYTGDEVGAEYEPYDEGPPIAWTDRHGLEAHYRRLIALRRAEPALRGPAMRLVGASPDDAVLAYVRPGAGAGHGAGEDLLVLLNFGDAPARARLAEGAWPGGEYRDLLGGASVAIDPAAPDVEVPAFGVLVLAREEGREGP